MRVDRLRLIGAPETNKVMAAELKRLAWAALRRRPDEPAKAGGAALLYPYEPDLATVAATYHRTASRALRDLYDSPAARLEPLHEELCADVAADDRGWIGDGESLSIEARNVGAFAAGARQIVGAVKNAIIEGAAARGLTVRVDPQRPDVLLAVRMHDDVVTVSVDLAGGSLTRRGYRAGHAEAPLRENLAAVLVMLARHDPRGEAVVDPMCGAGTILIEAALMARGAPLRADAGAEPLFPDTAVRALGIDRDRRAVTAARANAERAGAGGDVAFRRGDFRDVARVDLEAGTALDRGVILCNPPYGERLAADPSLLRDLAAWCGQFPGWRVGLLAPDAHVVRDAFGQRPRVVKPLRNGPLRVHFCLLDV